MKKQLLIFSVSFLVLSISAQPVIINGSNVPAPGYTAPVSMAATTLPGSAGANQTWDFSALTFSSLGTMNVITPSSSGMASSFPTANYAYTFSGTTSFFEVGATKMEVLAYTITSPGTGNDYSPNPRTMLKFPFSYQDTANDLWQKVGGSVNTVTITYDGYGTLITPTATYTNVVRVKEDYGSGGIDYQWYLTNPLMPIMIFDHNNNYLYYTGAVVTGTSEILSNKVSVNVFPNPSNGKVTFTLSKAEIKSGVISITNSLGQVVSETIINAETSVIEISGLASGIYYYQVSAENSVLGRGKLVVE